MKKLQREVSVSSPGGLPSDPWLLTNVPSLVEYLADTTFDGGELRTTSTLTIFFEGGLIKIALNDRDAGASLYRSGASIQDALLALQKALGTPDADWRPWRRLKKK